MMKLGHMLLDDIWLAEHKANHSGFIAPTDIRRVKWIEIHPEYFLKLQKEDRERDFPLITMEEINGRIENKFFGFPLRINSDINRWIIVI
jgi:hypothetical protein